MITSSLQLETGLPRIGAETFWNNLQSKHREEKQKTLSVFQTVTDQACERDQKVSSPLPGRPGLKSPISCCRCLSESTWQEAGPPALARRGLTHISSPAAPSLMDEKPSVANTLPQLSSVFTREKLSNGIFDVN